MGDEKQQEDWSNPCGYLVWRNDNVGRVVAEYWAREITREGKKIPILQKTALTLADTEITRLTKEKWLDSLAAKYPYAEPVHVDPDKIIQLTPSTAPRPGMQHVLFAKDIPGVGFVKVVRWPDDDHYLMLGHRLYNLKHLVKQTI